ncbi:MAG: hypothetical protein WBA57_13670 [Elainellaceae cyanobacterium]
MAEPVDFVPTDCAPVDIVILSNGPGELTTWVRPVVNALRSRLGDNKEQARISLVLSPCPNASGQEVAIAQRYSGIDRIQPARAFFPFLLFGKTEQHWDWRDRGVVVFLGGDQLYPIVIGKRLGYRTVIYGEWETRWHRWGDRYGVMNAPLIRQAAARYAHKFTVVGDLMADVASADVASANVASTEDSVSNVAGDQPTEQDTVGFLPGSKPAKLAQGMPLCLAIAHHIYQQRPQTRFVIPVAPTLKPQDLAKFAIAKTNPILSKLGGIEAEYVENSSISESPAQIAQPIAYLKHPQGWAIELHPTFPAYSLLRQCQICVTSIGANTAELGSLAVPMIVLMPTQQIDAMKAWDGVPGLLANLPGVGSLFATLINRWFLRKKRLLAWPNIWAGEEIVPERIGELQAEEIAAEVLLYLDQPKRLKEMSDRLRQARGEAGAAARLAEIIVSELHRE